MRQEPLPTPNRERSRSNNTNVLAIGCELYALAEAGALPVKLNSDLKSVEDSNLRGTLKRGFTAHPHRDPVTGDLHAILYEPGKASADYVVIDIQGQARYASEIQLPSQPMIHDTAITESFVVVLDLMMTFSPSAALSGKFPYVWNDKKEPRIGLVNRKDSSCPTLWFAAPPCSVYHIANAFELGDKVIVDVVTNRMQFDRRSLTEKCESPCLKRWTLNKNSGNLSEIQLAEQSVEYPRINDSLVGKEYDYIYTAMMTSDLRFGAAYKHSVRSATTSVHDFGPGRATMEPVFVARNGGVAEDDGWILSYVFDDNTNKTDVVILDARNFEGPPVATVQLPVRVPYGFHGNWIADSELG